VAKLLSPILREIERDRKKSQNYFEVKVGLELLSNGN
jgi:hypothetical protein